MSLLRTAATRRLVTRALALRSASTEATPTTYAVEPATAPASSTSVTETVSQPPIAADLVSGAPVELRQRTVRIFKPTKNTMQSGGSRTVRWRLDWDVPLSGGKWENPLMGWVSSADYMQGTRMSFKTCEDAIRFAEKQGWNFYVEEEPPKRIPPKNYSENYLYNPDTLRIAKTK